MVRKREISDALIEFAKSSNLSNDFGMPEKISTEKEANYFFVGVMLDRVVKTPTAWNSGELIVKKYGSRETDFWKRIRGMESGELHEIRKRRKSLTCLSRGNDG